MLDKKNVRKLKQCANDLKEACTSGDEPTVDKQLQINRQHIIQVLFSDIPYAVPLDSPKLNIALMQRAKPIVGISKSRLSESESELINFRQSYLDDFDSIAQNNDNLRQKVHEILHEYMYIYFNIQGKAKHFAYEFSDKKNVVDPSRYHPEQTFKKKCDTKNQYILLNVNVSVVGRTHHDKDSQIREVFTFLPKAAVSEWKSIK